MIKLLSILAALSFTTLAQAGEVTQHVNVISGKFSRAGSTNREAYSDSALKELCEQGYTKVFFLYAGAREKTVNCGGGRQLTYKSMTNWSSPSSMLSAASREMDAGGKVLVHCWYGVHASKYVAAAALNKFCGYSGGQAAEYFKRGIPPGSLPVSRIEELASRLRAYDNGGRVTGGCPSP